MGQARPVRGIMPQTQIQHIPSLSYVDKRPRPLDCGRIDMRLGWGKHSHNSSRVSSDYTGDTSCRPGSTLLIACHTLSSNSPSKAGFVLVIPHAAMTLWGIV